MNQTIVIIPARAGSKGIPDKNIQKIHDESLIAHAVSTAKHAKCVKDVYVTTDGADISKEAKHAGATVISQPAEISQDDCLSEVALLFALNQITNHPEFFIFMQCTCPLTLSEDIDAAVAYYKTVKADTLVTVAESITTPFIWQEDSTIPDGTALAIGHSSRKRLRRQEIKQLNYIENGAFYIININGFLQYKERFFGKIVMHKMPTKRSLDIDSETDLELAKMMMEL